MVVDLTPFGFTPTESASYGVLLDLGPSSGYAVAKALGIARANGYSALDGLVAKGAATSDTERPKRYRAVKPMDLFARIASREAAHLEQLEAQLASQATAGAEPQIPVTGRRAVLEILSRNAVRSSEPVECVARWDFLEALTPAWRARHRAGGETRLWSTDDGGGAIADIAIGQINHQVSGGQEQIILFTSADGGFLGTLEVEPIGFWTSDPLMMAVIRMATSWVTRA